MGNYHQKPNEPEISSFRVHAAVIAELSNCTIIMDPTWNITTAAEDVEEVYWNYTTTYTVVLGIFNEKVFYKLEMNATEFFNWWRHHYVYPAS